MIDDDLLHEVDTQKYLDVIFDKKMNWSSHVSIVCSKMLFYLFWINSHRKEVFYTSTLDSKQKHILTCDTKITKIALPSI